MPLNASSVAVNASRGTVSVAINPSLNSVDCKHGRFRLQAATARLMNRDRRTSKCLKSPPSGPSSKQTKQSAKTTSSPKGGNSRKPRQAADKHAVASPAAAGPSEAVLRLV